MAFFQFQRLTGSILTFTATYLQTFVKHNVCVWKGAASKKTTVSNN